MKTFSEQMLVGCDTSDSGYNGGLMEYSFTWLKKNGGIMTSTDYPYKGVKSICKSNKIKYVDMTITGYKKLGSSWPTWNAVDEDEVRDFLLETGPLAITLNAEQLQTYSSSILDLTSLKCPSNGINHAATLVGYSVENSVGLSETYGEQAGEKKDISESEDEMELVVSTAISLLLLFHSKSFILYLFRFLINHK